MNHIIYITLTLVLGLSAFTGCENHLKNSDEHTNQPKPLTPELRTTYSFDSHLISVEGRYEINQDQSVTLASPASSVRFLASGTRVQFSARAEFEEAFIDVLVDDKLVIQAYKLDQANHTLDVTLAENASGAHLVEILSRGEGDSLATRLINLETEKPIMSSLKSHRKLLFLGASVTCGALSEPRENCVLGKASHNGRVAYGTLIAHALNAESQLVCRSGRGILNGSLAPIPQDAIHILDYILTTPSGPLYWDHQLFTPDGILIALGNNDDLNNAEIFINAYNRFLNKLRTLYPNAMILLTEGPLIMGDRKIRLANYLNTIAISSNDPKIKYIPSQRHPNSPCSDHPDTNTHLEIAEELLPLIKEQLNW